MSRIEKPLPASLMRAIELVMADPEMSPGQKVEAAVLISHGYGFWCREEQIDPRALAIPQAQWTTICQGVIGAGKQAGLTDLQATSLSLEWMNVGPSSFRPEDAKVST